MPFPRTPSVATLSFIVVAAAATVPNQAQAQVTLVTCTASGPTLTFGTVNPYSGFPYTTSGTTSVACSNVLPMPAVVYACLSVGTGSGGSSPANRNLAAGAATLPIRITGGSSSPNDIGDGTSFPMEGPVMLSVDASSAANANLPLVITIPTPGSAPPPGSYTSSFTGADAQVQYTALEVVAGIPIGVTPSSCAQLVAGLHSTAAADFSVTAIVPTQCTVSATNLVFPTVSLLTHAVTASASISTICNAAVPVTVALDNGATGTGPTTRLMRSGTNAITYGIYRDAGATQPWGNIAGINTALAATGTATMTAYGQVPAQPSPPPGTYTDVVDILISY